MQEASIPAQVVLQDHQAQADVAAVLVQVVEDSIPVAEVGHADAVDTVVVVAGDKALVADFAAGATTVVVSEHRDGRIEGVERRVAGVGTAVAAAVATQEVDHSVAPAEENIDSEAVVAAVDDETPDLAVASVVDRDLVQAAE